MLYRTDKIEDYQRHVREMKEIQEILEELHENKTALYEEEQRLRANEPEFFSETDVTELLQEDEEKLLSSDNLLMDEDYPVYPPPEEDTEYEEFELIETNSTVDEDYYGEDYEDYYGEYFPAEVREKRDTAAVMEGLFETGGKLLSGNVVGSLTTFLKTLATPIFSYFIKSDNDHAMSKFTHRVLPETGFSGSSKAIEISRAAREGNGEEVWHRMSSNPRQWNPRSLYRNDRFHQSEIHRECRRNLPLYDRNLKNRLKEVSLLVTSLVTSLHDTTVADLNRGFKEATKNFDKIAETTSKILKTASSDKDAKTVIGLMENTAKFMVEIAEEMSDNTWTIADLTLAGVTVLFIGVIIILMVKIIHDNRSITEGNKQILEELRKLQEPNNGQSAEKNHEESTMRNAIRIAVTEAMEDAVRTSMEMQRGGLDRRGSGPTGGRFHGSTAVSIPSTALVRQAR